MTPIVTVDIGGTHARFALAEIAADGAIVLGEPVTLHTSDHASFQTAWEDFAARQGGSLPRAIAIAVAGPVGGEVIRFTNNPWIIRPALIGEKLGVDRSTLVNDFGAVGHAVARAGAEHFVHLAGPDEALPAEGTLSIVGPGTGLGVAHVWRGTNAQYRVQATEGGHIDFAPLDSIEDAILARQRKVQATQGLDRAAVAAQAHAQVVHLQQRLLCGCAHRCRASLGSSRSRRPSPIRFRPSTATAIATPG